MFLFLFSTAVPRTTLQWSIPLLFIFNYVFYIHPIGHFRVAFCLCVKTSLSTKPFIWLPPTGSLTHFYEKGFARRLVFETEAKRKHSSMSCSQEPLILTWKWPIKNFCIAYNCGVQSRKPLLISIKVYFTITLKKLGNATKFVDGLDKCGVNSWVSATFIFTPPPPLPWGSGV